MRLTTKRKVIIWIVVLFIVIVMGLRTTTAYSTETLFGQKKTGTVGATALVLYGTVILTSEEADGFHFVLGFGDYKYYLIAAALLIGAAAFFTVKEKPNKKDKARPKGRVA